MRQTRSAPTDRQERRRDCRSKSDVQRLAVPIDPQAGPLFPERYSTQTSHAAGDTADQSRRVRSAGPCAPGSSPNRRRQSFFPPPERRLSPAASDVIPPVSKIQLLRRLHPSPSQQDEASPGVLSKGERCRAAASAAGERLPTPC